MKKFTFTARTWKGKKSKGIVETNTKKEAIILLRKRKLVVISLAPLGKNPLVILGQIFGRITSKQVTTFTRQLATMIEAGLPLTDSLRLLEEQFSGKMGAMVNEVLTDVEGGSSFSKALKKYEKAFGAVFIASIRAGEEAGVLDKVLVRLADNLEKRREFLGKVKSAMIYPVIVVVGMGGVIFIVITFVIPKMMSLYTEFGSDLPASTKALMAISGFFSKFFWLLPILIVGLFLGYKSLTKRQEYRERFDRIKLSLPIVGKLLQALTMTEISRTLGMLVQTGVPLVEGLEIVAQSTGNEIYRESFEKSKDLVEKGYPFSEALREEKLIPLIVPQMISTGEETGKLDEVMFKLSKYFEVDADEKVKSLTSAIEPLIMIVLGLGVGFLVFAVIMPIYNLTSQF